MLDELEQAIADRLLKIRFRLVPGVVMTNNEEPKCSQQDCEAPPMFLYTWPGENEAYACVEHMKRIKTLSAVMGFHLRMLPVLGNVSVADVSEVVESLIGGRDASSP